MEGWSGEDVELVEMSYNCSFSVWREKGRECQKIGDMSVELHASLAEFD